MPAKGKHHHLSHHHHQSSPQQHQQQHLINVNQTNISSNPQPYNAVVAASRGYVSHTGSDFHVPGQNYGAQPGGQVGGGSSSIGVPGNRGPPSLSGIQSIGQTAPGIQSSGPGGAQQQPPQVPTPGVPQQQAQGATPTTTPPVHTPSPQEMGKQVHHQTQPSSLQQSYVSNQARQVAHGYFPMAQRPVQPRNSGHRGSQGAGATHVVSMQGVAGGTGQPSMYSHSNMNVPGTPAMFVSGQVPNLHSPHQSTMYPVNSQMPQLAFTQQHRHQTHQSQHYFTPGYPHPLIPSNMYPFPPGPQAPLATFCYPGPHPQNTTINLSRASANAVSGGTQHVGGPLAGAQSTPGVPQALQQSTQQQQTLPAMAISLTQPAYTGHNGGATNTLSSTYQKVTTRPNALMNIVDPATGKNVAEDIYRTAAAPPTDESSSRETPQPQDSAIAADFASRVAKAASETSDSNSSSHINKTDESHQQTPTVQSCSNELSAANVKIQPEPTKDTVNSQCNNSSSTPTQTAIHSVPLPPCDTPSTVVAPIAQVSCPIKLDTKVLASPNTVTWPQTETKHHQMLLEETSVASSSVLNTISQDDSASVQPSGSVLPTVDVSTKPKVSISQSVTVTENPSSGTTTGYTSTPHLSGRDPFPSVKNTVNSPPRRKHSHHHQQQQQQTQPATISTAASPSSVEIATSKETKERKNSDRSITQTSASHPDQYHQRANGEALGDKFEDVEAVAKGDSQVKSMDGKTMQKQKSKNKLKGRDLNRKGAEKEGTDMDAFVNSAQPVKPEGNTQELKECPSKTVDQQEVREISSKEKETNETKLDAEPEFVQPPLAVESSIRMDTKEEIINECEIPLIDKLAAPVKNAKDPSKDAMPATEDSNKCVTMLADQSADIVDHANTKETINVEAIVAQKNEENSKVSANLNSSVRTAPIADLPVVENQDENEVSTVTESTSAAATVQPLKYQYNSYQWSPRNTAGKKEYDSEFLLKLQADPRTRIRPPHLPDLEVVLKDCSRQAARGHTQIDMRIFKDTRAHEQLFPGFAKSSFNPKMQLPPTKKSYQGKNSKSGKPSVIHYSLPLHEDIKLRETENAWKPTRVKGDSSEEDARTEALYKKVRAVLNKLTPQKFDTLVNQVRALEIDTQEKLQGVIDLVFEKAIDEPSFSVAYALMCKELTLMKVASSDRKSQDAESSNVNFRKLLLTRCQAEFEKNTIDEVARTSKMKEIDNCTDLDKKKELQAVVDEEDRQIRMRSVGNIRFIGELYKQEMLTANIMHTCIKHLLQSPDEENLECLCKLLTTIGKIFELKADLHGYFNTLTELASRKGNRKISSRVRFMIQDVIDLRQNQWVPRRDESNPKTMDQIQKEAESERIDIQLNNTPRKDDRNSDRRRNRGGGSGIDDGWSVPVGKTRQAYSVEASKLSTKPPPMDEIKLGNRNAYCWNSTPTAGKPNTVTINKFALLENISLEQDKRPPLALSGSRSTGPREFRSDYKYPWEGRGSRNSSHQMTSSTSNRDGLLMDGSRSQSISMPPPPIKYKVEKPSTVTCMPPSTHIINKTPKTEDQLLASIKSSLDKCNMIPNTESFITTALETINDNFDNTTYELLVREAINAILERSAQVRQRYSAVLAHMINTNMIPLSLVQNEYEKIIEYADDLVIDIPKCWTYFAEILSEMIITGAHPLVELRKTIAVLKTVGTSGKLLGELFSKLARDQGPKWLADKWQQSGLEWSDLINPEHEKVDDILTKYNLLFLTDGCSNTEKSTVSGDLSLEQIHDTLLKLMRESNFDNITSWINAYVGERSKQPQFIRILITTIMEVSIEPHNDSWKLNVDTFNNLLPLITRYVDTEPHLELQCLFAIQAYNHKLTHPQGVLGNVIDALCAGGIISDDAFLAWQKSTDPAEMLGHAVAVKALTSFFVNLQETRDESSEEA